MRNFIQMRKYFYVFSIAMTIASFVALFVWGLKLGIDFRGGTLLEVSWSEGKVLERSAIEDILKSVSNVESLVVQSTGERNTLIRYASSDETVNETVLSELKKSDESLELIRSDFIGASVSEEIRKNAIFSLILAVIGIILYIAWAFRGVSEPVSSWHYGVQATVALAHDIVITLGVFAVLGHFFDVEVGASFVAALLTILGYSVNDTIVVYDRIRENLLRSGGKEDFEKIVNRSLNQTIARSFNTSFTVIIVLIVISIFGGESIRSFTIALLVGVSAGTYSSIYVATALLVSSNEFRLKQLAKNAENIIRKGNESKLERAKLNSVLTKEQSHQDFLISESDEMVKNTFDIKVPKFVQKHVKKRKKRKLRKR